VNDDDDLLARLRRIDPLGADVSIHPPDSPRAAHLMEDIMHATLTPDTPAPAKRKWAPIAWASGVAAAAAGGIFALGTLGGSPAASTVTYRLPASDPMASCLQIDQFVPPAGMAGFRGTVVEVDGDSIRLDVAKWYAGGDADEVVLDTAGSPSTALDGVEFVDGGDYLVSIIDGDVAICGVSGPADPVLEGLYDTWFG
jgi:hypothetical protein